MMDIASMLEVEVQEAENVKENVTPSLKAHTISRASSCHQFSKEENEFFKELYGNDIASVRFRKLHCTMCDEHIGSAPSESHNMHEHPVLRVLLCSRCRQFYGEGLFEQGEDATDMFCRWCANGGNLYCCSFCSNTFCSKCIKRNFDVATVKKIEDDDKWQCFVCDPKELWPARSLCRALLQHIHTVKRILENDSRMASREIEEKMHLDESKCCSGSRNKRKRKRRKVSNDEDDDEEDESYIPERVDTPPSPAAKKRKIRRSNANTSLDNSLNINSYSNGFVDHNYPNNIIESSHEADLTDLLIPREQTMIEGDTEILKPTDVLPNYSSFVKNKLIRPAQEKMQNIASVPITNAGVNPIPIGNLLRVGNQTYRIANPQSLSGGVGVPMTVIPKSVTSGALTLMKPVSNPYIIPKPKTNLVDRTGKPIKLATPPLVSKTVQKKSEPNVIDLGSDDEPEIVESEKTKTKKVATVGSNKKTESRHSTRPIVLPNETEKSDDLIDKNNDVEVVNENVTSKSDTPRNQVPLKIRQRDQRFKKMLMLQSLEIDNTVNTLKTKILKLLQVSSSKSGQDADLLKDAAICTKRFYKALKKTLIDLAQVNDRLVRDYLNWKKSFSDPVNEIQSTVNGIDKNQDAKNSEKSKENKEIVSNATENDVGMELEMICTRDSDSEAEDEESNKILEVLETPAEFSNILDHLALFKKKVNACKAVGDGSVMTEDKAVQAYEVPWRDYEKCIGYSLLTKPEFDTRTQKEVLKTVSMPDEHFGKYQEQFIYHLQHIEDHGIETEDEKGLVKEDSDQIPLKHLIENSSPFIMNMLGNLNPNSSSDNKEGNETSLLSDDLLVMNTSNCEANNIGEAGRVDSEVQNDVPTTSKNLEELAKLVSKINDEISNLETIDAVPLNKEEETLNAVRSLIESEASNSNDACNMISDN